MTISEKAAYLKGLMDGLELDTEKAEGKMIAAIVDLLGDVTKRLTDVEETTIAISDELDEIEEDLDAIEDFILDEEDDDYDGYDFDDEEDDDDFDDEGFDFGDEDTTIYEVKCICGNIIDFDEETLEKGSIICPDCGETLEFSLDDEDDFDDEEYEEGFDFGDEDSTIYEVVCPACDEIINFDEETLEKGSIICPDCGETLEFSLDEDEEDEE